MVQRTDSPLALENAYHWEKHLANKTYLTQPVTGGPTRDWSWSQAMDEVRRMAAHLKSLGLPPRSHVALMAKNQAHWIMADLAIWMAGHVSIPLYPNLTADTVSQILDHSGAKLILIGKLDAWDMMKDGVPASMPRIALPMSPISGVPTWDSIVASTQPLRDSLVRDADDLATIIYTSGSTGTPKGVMHSFRTMGVSGVGICKHLNVNHDDRMLSYLPLAHAFERFVVEMGSMASGFHIYFAESLETFVQDLQRARPTLFISVPRLWLKFQLGVFAKMPPEKLDRLLKIPVVKGIVGKKVLKGLGLDSVRFAGSGSAPIPADVIAWYRRLGLELLEGYGMTENFSYSHASEPGEARVGYVGTAYPDCECRISAAGEIEVKSPGTMLGYYKAPELTAEVMTEDGFLKTGDRGEMDEKGRLKITGRVKELFKTSKGKYVAPAPIENKLLSNTKLEQACVTGSGQPQPHAIVVLSEQLRADLAKGTVKREALTPDLEKLVKEVNDTLDPHEQLEFLVVAKDPWLIENGYLTPTLKIKRGSVEKSYGPMADGWYSARKTVIWQD